MGISYNPLVVTDGLVLYLDAANSRSYPGSGSTWNDLSGYDHNGTINGAVLNGNNRGSFSFDGSNDYVSFPYSSNLWLEDVDWTIDCWVNPSSFTDYGIIWDHGYGSPNTLRSIVVYINQTDGSVRVAQSPNGSTNYDVSLGLTLTTNNWQHLAIVRNSSNIVGYINGEVGSTAITAYSLFNSTTRSHYVGIQGDFQTITAYDGLISSLRVYKNKGLTISEIERNLNATKGRYGV